VLLQELIHVPDDSPVSHVRALQQAVDSKQPLSHRPGGDIVVACFEFLQTVFAVAVFFFHSRFKL
jgi:hypothetical protein